MSDTPLTDEQVEDHVFENKNHPHTDWVPASFARQLERELNRAKDLIECLKLQERDAVAIAEDRYRTELTEISKDKAMLDWLDLQDYAEFGDGERGDVVLEVLDDDGFPHHYGKGSARHCIDVAMNAMKGGE